jgi:hypothetical protein
MLTEVSQRLNLTIAATAALFCLCPLLSIRGSNDGQLFSEEGGLYGEVTQTLLERSPSLLAPLFVVLIPVADQLLEMPALISWYLHPDLKQTACARSTVVVRLNDTEKLLFMLGMCIQSSAWFLPAQSSVSVLGLVYFCTTNASILFVMAPILTFLQRCTTTYTNFRATAITVTASVGVMTFTISNFLRYNNFAFRVLDYLAWILVAIAGSYFVALINLCAIKYCRTNLATPAGRQALLRLFMNQKDETNEIKTDTSIDNDSELYENYIPALHMISMFVMIIAGLYVGLVPHEYQRMAYDGKNYVILCAEILILVVELRIRKNEITRGLVRKQHVLFINSFSNVCLEHHLQCLTRFLSSS